jgi:hypothetical protein
MMEEILEPEEVQANPALSGASARKSAKTLDYEPARFLRRRIVPLRFAGALCVAPPGLLAQLIVNKFCRSHPTYGTTTQIRRSKRLT